MFSICSLVCLSSSSSSWLLCSHTFLVLCEHSCSCSRLLSAASRACNNSALSFRQSCSRLWRKVRIYQKLFRIICRYTRGWKLNGKKDMSGHHKQPKQLLWFYWLILKLILLRPLWYQNVTDFKNSTVTWNQLSVMSETWWALVKHFAQMKHKAVWRCSL